MTPIASTDTSRWQAVLDRDPAGGFVYAVVTTGIYCRPDCPSRRAKRENVRFFDTGEDAQSAGFRACLRCRPGQADRNAALVERACRMIEDAEEAPDLRALAEAAGLSTFHFHRLFKARTGVTPREYARALRDRRVRAALGEASTVTEALYDAGFGSSGRFYAGANASLGMTPTRFKAGGQGETIRYAWGESSLGGVLVAATSRGVCAIMLGDDRAAVLDELRSQFRKAALVPGGADFDLWVAQVVACVDDPRLGLGLPLDIRGTAFQQRVWRALVAIPVGETRTYTQIAESLGTPNAVRAVASACASNPISVAIPCHRVQRIGGALAGYRWGLERKRALLDRESEE
ncbi:bifunctional DNA-binding transcriptional regulator/O6-methylguanine-DNA methyltransferase Ada [Emcibacter sp. SYSU 3D8]|uniref:bifunctional DNA-binding transcriptional regulator/O6-methylguanine-DNA methyltransferase Ada n=1 Tax=Emcibacter sp. SYSU 3D8 TaxID=3133969 RepID=UPI0031FEAF64